MTNFIRRAILAQYHYHVLAHMLASGPAVAILAMLLLKASPDAARLAGSKG